MILALRPYRRPHTIDAIDFHGILDWVAGMGRVRVASNQLRFGVLLGRLKPCRLLLLK